MSVFVYVVLVDWNIMDVVVIVVVVFVVIFEFGSVVLSMREGFVMLLLFLGLY